jgi:hypothetical protein
MKNGNPKRKKTRKKPNKNKGRGEKQHTQISEHDIFSKQLD